MTDTVPNYAGDDALTKQLAAADATLDAAAAREIIAGVVGAPENGDAWIELVVRDADDGLAAQLRALRAEIAAATDPGFMTRPPAARLENLRRHLAADGLDGFLVPRTDEYQGEFVAPRADRLRWLTGFSGSAGLAIVLLDKAAIFVDGRYTLQIRQQADDALFEPHHLTDSPPADWIGAHLNTGAKLGYDPRLHSENTLARFRKATEKAGAELVPADANPIDAVWADQPAAPLAPIRAHELKHAGKSSAEKRGEIGAILAEEDLEAVVLTMPDSIAWLLNVRGGDVGHTPLALSYAILRQSGAVEWFVDARKLTPGLTAALGNAVAVQPAAAFGPSLEALAEAGARVRVDPATASGFVFDRLAGAKVDRGEDPCALPKAIKNEVEIAGTRAAHLRDGGALTRFLAWFAEAAPAGGLSELSAADRLQAFRTENGAFRDLSFPTISSAGPNGAVVHYHATPETDRAIGKGELYLVDSGAQYPDGTTDVTRTIVVGTPPPEMKDRFTRGLMGHIAIAMARFPEGTTGTQLDTLARSALWRAGLDFDHGTGHGVGSYLGVHEGPHRISKAASTVALEPGMIVSNEPGYYKADAYGIRIENLVVVRRCEELTDPERPTLEFETLTLAPIDLALVETALMSPSEIDWLNRYHERVRTELGEGLSKAERAWLEAATRPRPTG